MKGILEGECECSFIDGIKCLLYGDEDYAKFLKRVLGTYSPQNEQDKIFTEETKKRLNHVIEQFEV